MFPEDAQLGTAACASCGKSPTISGERLKPAPGEHAGKAVCADCLRTGTTRVDIPKWIERELVQGVATTHPDWSEDKRTAHIAARIAELAHTPPVPWIQNNEWPVCGNDFAMYMGEVTREWLVRRHRSEGRAKEALRAIVEEERPAWQQDEETLETEWEQLGNVMAIFTFRCWDRPKDIYVIQTA